MDVINLTEVGMDEWKSPKGKFGCYMQNLSVALGHEPMSTDRLRQHPFEVEIHRVPPGKVNFPYHSHGVAWEYYQVTSGQGIVRHEGGETQVGPGDCFIFKPNASHQICNEGSEDLIFMIISDNPTGDTIHYPDSGKWLVDYPGQKLLREGLQDYFEGEE